MFKSDSDYQRMLNSVQQWHDNPPQVQRPSANQMIAMRLHTPAGEMLPFQHLSVCQLQDKTFVFVVQDNQAVTLEDDPVLFPSDSLITSLRLLQR